jgi:hypothetical protein
MHVVGPANTPRPPQELEKLSRRNGRFEGSWRSRARLVAHRRHAVHGMSDPHGACDRSVSTPGVHHKPDASETPSTAVVGEAIGGRAATAFPTGAPPVDFAEERVDSRPSNAEAQPFASLSDDSTESPSACAPMPELQPAAQPAPDPPLAADGSKEALRKRLESMLFGDGERPRASGLGGVVEQATNALMVDLREAAGDLWRDREDDIKSSVSLEYIDEIDTIAYLAADAHGRPLLHPDDTNGVGKRVASQATRAAAAIKSAEKTAADAVRRATAAAAADPSKLPKLKAAEAKGAQDVAAVRDKPTPAIEWPTRTVGRKRAREPPPVQPELPLVQPAPSQPPPAPSPPPAPTDAAFSAAVQAAMQRELARRSAAAVEAAQAAEARRHEEAQARLQVARAELIAAETRLKLAKQARARMGPPPQWVLPPRMPCLVHFNRDWCGADYAAALRAEQSARDEQWTASRLAWREEKRAWDEADLRVACAESDVDDA